MIIEQQWLNLLFLPAQSRSFVIPHFALTQSAFGNILLSFQGNWDLAVALCLQDLLAVGYREFVSQDQKEGLACCWSLKNPMVTSPFVCFSCNLLFSGQFLLYFPFDYNYLLLTSHYTANKRGNFIDVTFTPLQIHLKRDPFKTRH